MLRVKIVVAYVILVLAFVAGVFFVVRWDFSSLINDNVDATLRRVAASAEQASKIESNALTSKASFAARGDKLYRAVSGELTQEAEGDVIHERHMETVKWLRAQEIRLEDIMKSAQGKPDAAKTPLETGTKKFDLFIVLDNEGVGVAALGKDLLSWYKDDVGKEFPIVHEALKGKWEQPRTDYWMWAYKPGEEKRLHEVAIAPIRRSDGEKPVGVLILGNTINDGKAKSKIGLMAGDEENDSNIVELAYFKGGDVIASTFDAANQEVLKGQLAKYDLSATEDGVNQIMMNDVEYHAAFRQLGEIGEDPFGLVVLKNVQTARRPMDATITNVVILGIIVLLLGIGLLLFLIVQTMKPIEELEAGIHQVIAGNKDYVFEPSKGNSLQNGLAQALNLMSAFLQGKPMPDDDNPSGGWGDMMDAPTNQGPAKVQGVALPGMRPKAADDSEPTE